MAKKKLDKAALLAKLPEVKYQTPEKSDKDRFDQVHFAGSFLLLAELGHEQEYVLCCSIAKHLLGTVPEPDDAELGDDGV